MKPIEKLLDCLWDKDSETLGTFPGLVHIGLHIHKKALEEEVSFNFLSGLKNSRLLIID